MRDIIFNSMKVCKALCSSIQFQFDRINADTIVSRSPIVEIKKFVKLSIYRYLCLENMNILLKWIIKLLLNYLIIWLKLIMQFEISIINSLSNHITFHITRFHKVHHPWLLFLSNSSSINTLYYNIII